VKLYATDCEGPISKNDNAYELCERFLPEGAAFFERVSRYDDYLADVVRKPGYRPGDTLRLILPFLRATGTPRSSPKLPSCSCPERRRPSGS